MSRPSLLSRFLLTMRQRRRAASGVSVVGLCVKTRQVTGSALRSWGRTGRPVCLLTTLRRSAKSVLTVDLHLYLHTCTWRELETDFCLNRMQTLTPFSPVEVVCCECILYVRVDLGRILCSDWMCPILWLRSAKHFDTLLKFVGVSTR